ncbi:MAG: lysophospholipid acyltransferase family protein [bacterium]
MAGRFREARHLAFLGGVRTLQALATVLPRRAALVAFSRLGDLVRHVDRPAERRIRSHLELAFGAERSMAEREALVREVFRATGRNLVDVLSLRKLDRERSHRLAVIEGRGHLEAALARGRGVVALSAHFGSWEVLAACCALDGLPVHVIARELFDSRADRWLNEWRERAGVVVHRRSAGLVGALRALRAGEIVAALPDQDTRGRSAWIEFFGRPARTPTGPFVLARRAGAAMVPVFCHLAPDGRHRIRFLPALPASAASDRAQAIREDMVHWHEVLEGAIREHPEQWVWYHRRWKSRPETNALELERSTKEPAYLQVFQPSRELANTR